MWWAITRKRINSRVQVTNIKGTTYTNYINQYTARDTVGKGYRDLAASIGPTSEKPFTNTISNQSFDCSKESVFRQFRTSHASHGCELNTLVTPRNFINWSCNLTLFQREVVGDSPRKVRGVGESTKQ